MFSDPSVYCKLSESDVNVFLESVQEQLGEAEGEGLWAALGLPLYTHRQS